MLKQLKQLNKLDLLFKEFENLKQMNLDQQKEIKQLKTELNEFKKSNEKELLINANESIKFDTKLKTDIKAVKQDVEQLELTVSILTDTVENLKNEIAEVPVIVIGETGIGENILSYHLRTSPQTQSKNYRYYYKSNYLFTAPLNLKNLLTIEFNRLMNSNLSFENVIEKLKVYKTSLETELNSNGIQTDLGVVLNE